MPTSDQIPTFPTVRPLPAGVSIPALSARFTRIFAAAGFMWCGSRLLIPALTVLTAACGRTEMPGDVPEFGHERLDVRVLESEPLTDAPIIGRPISIELSNEILWIRDGTGDPYVHAIDASTGEILRSIGRKGEGPGEFQSVFGLTSRDPADGSVWAFDLQLQRLTLLRAQDDRETNPLVITLNGAPRVMRASWLGANEILGVTGDPGARFVRFDTAGGHIGSMAGALPGDSTAAEAERRKALTAFALCHVPGRGFAMTYQTAGRLEIYDGNAEYVDTAAAPYPSRPVFRPNDQGRMTWRFERAWYLDCAASGRHVYGLFSGRRLADYSTDEQGVGRFLHVFSWNGDLVRVFRLSTPVASIAVDASETTLYGSSTASAGVYRFRLPVLPVR